jgi:hypothetical protein
VPSEDDLRAELGRTPTAGAIDLDRVITRSRARRRPRQVATTLVGALALTGVLVIGVQTLPRPASDSATIMESESGAADGGAASEDAALSGPAAPTIAACAAPTAAPTGVVGGLALELVVPTSVPVGTLQVEGAVRVTNVGTTPVSATTPPVPAIAVSENGIVVWHTNGPTILSLATIELAPGLGVELPASATLVRCAPEDDTLPEFRPDLPALPAGDYALTAAMDVADAATGEVTRLVSDSVLVRLTP